MNKQHFTETQIPDGAFLGILGRGGRPILQILTLFQTKKCYFSHPFSDLAFKKLCRHYLDYSSNKKYFLKSIWIRIFLFLSYSFGTETVNTFVHSRSALENHTRFQTKMGKECIRFETKTAQKPFGVAHRYVGEYPPGPDNTNTLLTCSLDVCHVCLRESIFSGLEELVWRSSKL